MCSLHWTANIFYSLVAKCSSWQTQVHSLESLESLESLACNMVLCYKKVNNTTNFFFTQIKRNVVMLKQQTSKNVNAWRDLKMQRLSRYFLVTS